MSLFIYTYNEENEYGAGQSEKDSGTGRIQNGNLLSIFNSKVTLRFKSRAEEPRYSLCLNQIFKTQNGSYMLNRRIRIARSNGVPDELLKKVLSELNPVRGPLVFEKLEDAVPLQGEQLEFNEFFEAIGTCRHSEGIPEEDYVALVTDCSNAPSWFAGHDEKQKNVFVYSDDWEYFISCPPRLRLPTKYWFAYYNRCYSKVSRRVWQRLMNTRSAASMTCATGSPISYLRSGPAIFARTV